MSVDIKMKVTEKDAERAASIVTRHNLPSRAQAVSVSLALTDFIGAAVEQGAHVVLVNRDGTVDRVVHPELGLS